MPYTIPANFGIDKIVERSLMHPVAYAVIDPRKTSAGEYPYRDGLQSGIRIFHSGSIVSTMTVARSADNGDPIGDANWVSDAAFLIRIGAMQVIHEVQVTDITDQPIRPIVNTFTVTAHATTGLGGQVMYEFINRAGESVLRPTDNLNSFMHILVFKRETA